MRARRKALNVSQREVGELIGVVHSTVCQWERNARKPRQRNELLWNAALNHIASKNKSR
ncbi:helix-turn-helix domain-containing protein [Streptomyces sp. NBC_00435]|uniref:helix-turn-helix domain-containing protein n=1 Tax=Streptomyces sp. NBC_00435 TaxID=2903649 RepID=UPI003FA6B0AA